MKVGFGSLSISRKILSWTVSSRCIWFLAASPHTFEEYMKKGINMDLIFQVQFAVEIQASVKMNITLLNLVTVC